MALMGYLTVEGSESGKLVGTAQQAGREDKIEVYAFAQAATVPTSIDTGKPTGSRVHTPFNITTKICKASPIMMQMATSGEQAKSWILELWETGSDGKDTHYYTIELDGAVCTSSTTLTKETFVEENRNRPNMHETSWTFSKITHTYLDGGVTGTDSFNA